MSRSVSAVRVWSLALMVVGFPGDTAAPRWTATGWFACDRCAPARLRSPRIGPTNRECTQRCIAEGANLVFIAEKTRTILQVANPDLAKGQEGHYVQVTGSVDKLGKTLRLGSVNVLERYIAKCGRPG